MVSRHWSTPDGVLTYWGLCLGPASQLYLETGQHSFLLQADSTRLTLTVLLNSAPVWAEDVQWKLNLRHLGPERANHCTDSLYTDPESFIENQSASEWGRADQKKRSYFRQHPSRNKVIGLCLKSDISLKSHELQKFHSYLPSNSPPHKGRSSKGSLQRTR